jgi:hypothetical protein
MVAITYGTARIVARKAVKAARAEAPPRKPWYARFMDALIESRMQQAQREINQYLRLLPHTLDERGNRVIRTRAGDLPLGGR